MAADEIAVKDDQKFRVVLSAGKNLLDDVVFSENSAVEKITETRAKELLGNGFVSAVGLPQTEKLFTSRLGLNVRIGKEPVTIQPEQDCVVVGEYDRTVCYEDQESFPTDAQIDWYLVKLKVPWTWYPPS